MKESQPQQWGSEAAWSGDQCGQQWGREEGWRRGGGEHQLLGQGGSAGNYSGSTVAARGFSGSYMAGLQGFRSSTGDFRGSLAGNFRGSDGS